MSGDENNGKIDTLSWRADCGDIHEGPIVSSKGDVELIACRKCGFVHIIPITSDEELKRFYETEFYEVEKQDYLSMDEDEQAWLSLEFTDRYSYVESILDKGSCRVLDIGCGPGDFLVTGKQRGWEVVGIEPSPAASEYARSRGVSVHTGFFSSEVKEILGKFDFIHMSEVLEHVANPTEIVAVASQMLKSGGVMCVSVPNDFNVLQNTYVKKEEVEEWWVVPDHHLNYFTFETLEKLLAGQEFMILDRTTNFPMELFLLMGQNYTNDPSLGSKLHGWRKKLDHALALNADARQKFYRSLAQADMGRLSIVYAQKPT